MEATTIKIFEFTTQEESEIKEVLTQLSEITCVLLAEGVKTDEVPSVNVFDIIHHILENYEKGRGDEMRFAVCGAIESNGVVKIFGNLDYISPKSINFLEELLTNQIEFFKKNIPAMLDVYKSRNFHILTSGTEIHTIENSQQKEI